MSRGQTLRALVTERLTAAAEEIFALVERTITEYEEELCRCKEDNQRKQQLLDEALSPQVNAPSSDFQIKTEERDETGSSLDQVADAEVSEREERLRVFTAAFVTSNEPRVDDWSYDWEPQPSGSHQLDSDDEDFIPITENDDAFMEFPGKKTSTKTDADGKVKHECPVCRKKLGRKQELKRHMLLHTGEKPFSCPVCHKRFIQKSNLKSHIVTHLDSVDTIIRFQKPLESVRGEAEGEAEGEDWGSTEGDKLTDTLLDSDNEEDWTQALEPGASRSSQQLERMETGEVEEAGETGEAGEEDPEHGSLERISHLLHQALNQSKARGKPTEFQCPMCDKVFRRMENVRRHLLVHTGEKAFSCPVCNRQFTLKQHLKLHMVLHTRDQQFSCSVCAKTFIRKDNLRSHMRIHSAERPFGCSQCGVRFFTDADLARHTAQHTERPFVCLICNSAFLSRRYLTRHIKIHQREAELNPPTHQREVELNQPTHQREAELNQPTHQREAELNQPTHQREAELNQPTHQREAELKRPRHQREAELKRPTHQREED